MKLRSAACAVLLVLTWSGATAAPSAFDNALRLGYEEPDAALAEIEHWPAGDNVAAWRRQVARGLVLALNGRQRETRQIAEALRVLPAALHGALGLAGADLVLAQLNETEGRADRVLPLAAAAAARFAADCAADAARCERAAHWEALMLGQRAAARRGQLAEAGKHAQAALELADASADPARRVLALAAQAVLAAREGQAAPARQRLAQARKLGDTLNLPGLALQVTNSAISVALRLTDTDEAQRLVGPAIEAAQSLKLQRLQASMRINLADLELKQGHPAAALAAAQAALPVVRSHQDTRAEAAALHNSGLARVALGHTAAGRQELDAALAVLERAGAQAELALSLREYGQTLAQAGDVAGALALYHRERKLTAETLATDRDAALAELQSRFNSAAQQAEIDLKLRQNAVGDAQLANRGALQKVWSLLAAVAVLALGVVALLVRRLHETQRQLRQRQASLRLQSERDPLTGLANRHHAQQVLAQMSTSEGGFQGTLLLIDLDHFKHVNDGHGHGAGDTVLVEVARRLESCVREGDLLARWGGEEFVLVTASRHPDAADTLAERVMAALASQPVVAEGVAIPVTASIGYGSFPLAPHGLSLRWERALNLADMALYSAKSQGRQRAFGISAVSAQDDDALRAVEADFESAVQATRVTLTRRLSAPALAMQKVG